MMLYIIGATIFLGLNVADVLSSNAAGASGNGKEGNGLAAWFMTHLGSFWWIVKVPGLVGIVVLPFIVPMGIALMIVAAFDLVYGAIIYNNYSIAKTGKGLF